MKTHTITEQQLQEIAGRLNALTIQGITNAEHVAGIMVVLAKIVEPKPEAETNVVEMKKDAQNG